MSGSFRERVGVEQHLETHREVPLHSSPPSPSCPPSLVFTYGQCILMTPSHQEDLESEVHISGPQSVAPGPAASSIWELVRI